MSSSEEEEKMAIAASLKDYLARHGVTYDEVVHDRAMTMLEAARRARLPDDCVVKAVVLEDDEGFVLAAIPASHHVRLSAVRKALNRRLGLATEGELAGLFIDCEVGAAPPVGAAYGLADVVIDESLDAKPDLYFEGGDHRTLVHVRGSDFNRLMGGARHGRISRAGRASWGDGGATEFM
jgi:Ala-tRNA(Pro) deacylase